MQVAYPATPVTDANVTLQDIKISVIGSEIVDPKWVSKSYHALQPAVHSSSRVRPPVPTVRPDSRGQRYACARSWQEVA